MSPGKYIRTKEIREKISLSKKGALGGMVGNHHSDYTREKISKSSLGKKHSEESKKKISIGLTGRPVSQETRKKLSLANKGKKPSPQTIVASISARLGKKLPPRTKEWSENLSRSLTGKKRTEESKRKQSETRIARKIKASDKLKFINSQRKGPKNNKWKGGITPLVMRIRHCPQYRQWRDDIFHRDNYKCQECGDRGGNGHTVYLEAHHIKDCSKIMEEYNIKTFEDALMCYELWNINNGLTLCDKCQNKTKKGRKNKNK